MTPSRAQGATAAVLGLRIAYGVGLILAPRRLGRRWLGPASATAPTQVPLRALGAREVVLHTGALAAAWRGRSVRPWLAGSVAGDATDLVATLAGRRQLPASAPLATLLVAGGSALVSVGLGVVSER